MIESPGAVPPDPASRRVLFLDDDPRRAEMFLSIRPYAVWVTSADACIARLAETWDEVHLDHDLNGEHFVDVMRDDCGMAVIRWLCSHERRHLREARFFVHSHNSAAATQMVDCLLSDGYAAEYRPFGLDLVDFLRLGPPPRRSGVRLLLGTLWERIVGCGSRLTRPSANRYDVCGSRGEDSPSDREKTSEEGS